MNVKHYFCGMNQVSNNWLAILALWFYASFLFAQEEKQYSGPLVLDTYSGKANYQYKISNGDTIYNGPFQFQKSNLETLLKERDSSFLIRGSFKDGLAQGPWQFQFGKYTSESKSEVVDYEYRILVSGVQEKGYGNFLQGEPEGAWVFTIQDIKDSEVENTAFKSTFTFKNGIPQQSFKIENDTSALVGRLLRNGLAHDEWTLYGSDGIDEPESWYFEEGVLTSIRLGSNTPIPIFDGAGEEYISIPLDIRFLSLLQTILRGKYYASSVTKLLRTNITEYKKASDIINHLNSKEFNPGIKVKVPYFPLDSLQSVALKQIVSNYEEGSTISKNILEDSHLNIVKRTDTEANYLYNVTQNIHSNFLLPLEGLIRSYEDGIINLVNINNVVPKVWGQKKPTKAIVIKREDSGPENVFELRNAADYNFEGSSLESLVQITDYAKAALLQIQSDLSPKLSSEMQMQSLEELENILIKLNNELEQQVDSAMGTIPKAYHPPLQRLTQLADDGLGKYATFSEPSEKLSYGETLKGCLVHSKSLASTIASLPVRIEEIKKLYTDDIWNPFMATVMEEEVKKRVVHSYIEILVPYFLKSSTELDACDQIEVLNQEINFTQQRIQDLRDVDTKKLERKLRRERRPKEILILLHNHTTSKEDKHGE